MGTLIHHNIHYIYVLQTQRIPDWAAKKPLIVIGYHNRSPKLLIGVIVMIIIHA